MNTCQIPATAMAPAASSPVADLQLSIQRNMLMTAQRLVADYDAIQANIAPGGSFFAEQVKAKFGLNIITLRGCITNTLQLADHAVKGSLQ